MLGNSVTGAHAVQGSHLVQGSAGSGKTTALVDRATALLEAGEKGILVLVHSRRTARALSGRILRAAGRSTDAVRVLTWHSFALGLLREHYLALGAQEPSLLTGPEQFTLVRDLLDQEIEAGLWTAFPKQRHLAGFVEELREFVLRAQDAYRLPEDLATEASNIGRPDLAEAARFFRRYLDRIDTATPPVVDHANVIARAVMLLRDDEDIATALRAQTHHVMVDDYQDVTPAQAKLLRELAGTARSVVVAADPNLGVFAFRGASPGATEDFAAAFAPVTVHELTATHRAPPERDAWVFEHRADETDAIARECRRLRARHGISYGDIAIIVRRFGSTESGIRRALRTADVPHVVLGENRALAAEPALRPMLLLARAALRPAEREDLLPGLLASPVGGLDMYEVRALRRAARIRGTTLDALVADAAPADATGADGLPPHVADSLATVRGHLEATALVGALRPDKAFKVLWDRLDYFADLVADDDAAGLDAVTAFARALERFAERRPGKTFAEYLDLILGVDFGPEPWQMPEDRRPDAVRILTAHNATATGFAAVIVAGCVEGEFPDATERRVLFDVRDLIAPAEPHERAAARLQEEERLFDLATSRATTRLLLTAARASDQAQPFEPSRLVARAGLTWGEPPGTDEPVTRAEAEARARRSLGDVTAPAAERDAALEILARLPDVDPDTWWFERERTESDHALIGEEFLASYSRLSPYENCPLSYVYQRELGLDPSSSHAMRVGSWVHEVIEHASKHEIPLDIEALHAALAELWDPTVFPNPAIESQARRDCAVTLQRWIDSDGTIEPLAVEADFRFAVEGALIRGKIDRIVRCGGHSTRVIDYKTGRSSKSENEVREDLQLATYYLASKRDPALVALGEPMRLELAYIASDSWKSRPGVDPRTIPGYEANAVERLESLVAGIRAEEFAPSDEADCTWCSFKRLCPLWQEGMEVVL